MISIPAEWMAGVFMIWRSHRRFMMTDSSTLWLDPFDCDVALRDAALDESSEEHTSELQSLMRISYAVFCLQKQMHISASNSKQYYRSQSTYRITCNRRQ